MYTVKAIRNFDDTTVIEDGKMKKRTTTSKETWEVDEDRYNALIRANGVALVSIREIEKPKTQVKI
jgi:hypothetical protein